MVEQQQPEEQLTEALPLLPDRERILRDFRICCLSRELSIMLRREVLTGKAKFGIGGAGKEVPQAAMARAFQKGDFWAGYYRDQTFMLAKGLANTENYFSFLYGDTENDPFSGGRQMNNCYGAPLVDAEGNWLKHTDQYNAAATLAPVAGQLTHAIGLAFASKKYRENRQLKEARDLSHYGNEVCFATIGDAGAAEGVFFETVNAAAVLGVPLAIFIWDDGYGISVPAEYQIAKQNISEILSGFSVNEKGEGIDIYTLNAWDYEGLCTTIEAGIRKVRERHIPAIFHVRECTQPQGHSSSGSHERYKSEERLAWERENDCIRRMETWMRAEGIATRKEIEAIREAVRQEAKAGKSKSWKAFRAPINTQWAALRDIYRQLLPATSQTEAATALATELAKLIDPAMSQLMANARKMRFTLRGEEQPALDHWLADMAATAREQYNTHLYSETARSALNVPVVPAVFEADSPWINGYEIINAFFDQALAAYPELYAFGEDVGKIGDVNQGFAGLQEKYGEERVFDTGIREWTIVGQAIGMAMRGLRPVAEIQYLDYLAYAFAPLTDDLATVRYRSDGTQIAPAIIRTRGHRLEGIWHSGSPMGMMLHSLRGIYLLVPRNMTQAAGMYHTLLQSDDPGIVVECLNGYRLKEQLPANMGTYTVPLGVVEVLQAGTDLTLVTYGSCVRIAQAAIEMLAAAGISVELIDAQSLIPFDRTHQIVHSLKKTNRILFLDEDVPGGATAYMMQEVLEKQGGYRYLDSPPTTLTAKEHRPAYADDGNYYSKPNVEDVVMAVYEMMQEADPARFP